MPFAVTCALFGMCVGIQMAASKNHGEHVAHALIGCTPVAPLPSGNAQDRSLETSVTSLLIFGPLGALVAGIWATVSGQPLTRLLP